MVEGRDARMGAGLPPPTWRDVFLAAPPGFFWVCVCVVAAGLYLCGVFRLRQRGDRWPWWRTALWLVGIFAVYLVRGTGFGRYAMVLFSAHMAAHMALNMYAPIPLVLAAPMTLALRSLPAGRGRWSARGLLLRFLHSRVLAVISSLPVAVGVFVFSLYGLYFTPLFAILMSHRWGMLAMQIHFLVSGYLFAWTLIGADPGPRRPPALTRLAAIVPTGTAHAFFGVTLVFSHYVFGRSYLAAVKPAWASLQWNQTAAGAIAAGVAEAPMTILAVVLFLKWFNTLERATPAAPGLGVVVDRPADVVAPPE